MRTDSKAADSPLLTPVQSKAAIYMLLVLLLSYVINAMDRQLFSVVAVDVRKSLGASLQEIGFASTVFTLGMGVAGIPTAYLMSRMSRKTVSLVGLVIFSLATFLTAYSQGLSDLLVYRFLSGLGEAMQFTAILAILTSYFHSNRGLATGSVNFTFGLGAILGPNLGAWMLKLYDWQTPFITFGLAAIPIGLLIVLYIKEWFSEAKPPVQSSAGGSAMPIEGRSWSSSTVYLCLSAVLAGQVIYGYLGLYPTFLRDALGFSPSQAGFLVSFYGFGALASIAGGWIGDKYDFRKLLSIAFLVAGVTGWLLFTGLDHSMVLHAFLSFVFGATISGMVFVNLAAGIIKSMHPEKSGLGAGLFVACLYISAAFSGYILATLRNALGWENAAAIQLSLLAVIAALLVSLAKQDPFTTLPH